MSNNFQEILFQEVLDFFKPIIDTQGDAQEIINLFEKCGWDINSVLDGNVNGFVNSIAGIMGSLDGIKDVIENPPDSLPELMSAIKNVAPLFGGITNIADSSVIAHIAHSPRISELPEDAVHLILSRYLYLKSPFLYRFLELAGIIAFKSGYPVVLNGAIIHIPSNSVHIYFEELGNLFSDPAKYFKGLYWPNGIPNIQEANKVAANLFPKIANLLAVLNIRSFVGRGIGPEELGPSEEERLKGLITFTFPYYIAETNASGSIDLSIGLVPENEDGPGVFVVPSGNLEISIPIKQWKLSILADAQIDGFSVTKNGFNIYKGAGNLAGFSADAILLKKGNESAKAFLIGSRNSTRFEIGKIEFGGGVSMDSKQQEFRAFVDLHECAIIIAASEGDSFLNAILGPEGINVGFNLKMCWSNLAGFHFEGSGQLEIFLPAHISLGPIEIQNAIISLRPSGNELPLGLTSTIKGVLGPIQLVVEDVGIILRPSFPSTGGNLGPIDFQAEFKPPRGVGLAINAGVIKGGGYLYFNFDKEEYAGALELVISEFLTLKAIGLITTRMPDGSKGFSMLIIITAEFGSPIQLSFGFTLSAVGGLLGLNRTMLLQPLAEGVRTGAVNSVMFPTNVVANAPRIISDLRSFFPPHEGIFLIGPMAKIGWGTPNLVTLSLGVIIEIPGNIAILGVLKITLPDENAALLVLQANFIGAIEFDKKRVWFFASMFESRILFMTIEGEMGLLVAWGDDANFVVSVGGFHPAFTAPPLPFPEPRRIAISILNTDFARIRVEGYFAVTSNTVQFGARAELYFGLDAFNIDGHLAFDALFQFSPFYFIITISASLSVKVLGIGFFSVNFRGSLEGPTPWKVSGTGSISLLFFDIDVDFSHTWGEEVETTLPPINVVPLLVAEFEKLENWKAEIPFANRIFVSLRKIEAGSDLSETSENLEVLPPAVVIPDTLKDKITYDATGKLLSVKGVMSREDRKALFSLSTDDLYRKAIEALFQRSQFIVLHPVGTLKISQRAVPLELTLDKVGAQKPGDANYFTINVTSPGLSKKGNCEEPFAMAQFKNMSDSQKLSSPAYQKWNSGVELSADTAQANTSLVVKRVVRYEKIIIDTNYKRFVKPLFVWFTNLFTLFLNGNTISRSSVSQHYFKQKQPFEDKVAIQADIWVVASSMDNSPLHPTAGSFTSQAKAYEYMQQQVAANSELADQVHVIPKTEVRRAA